MDTKNRIATKGYICGRYKFYASLPQIGFSDDKEEWTAAIDGRELPARFATLEDAMRAVLGIAPTTRQEEGT